MKNDNPHHIATSSRTSPVLHLARRFTVAGILFLLFCLPLQAAKLPVPFYSQSDNNWCWAASTAMLAKYYRNEQFTQMKPAIVAAINDASPTTGDNLLCTKIMNTLAFIDPDRTYVRNTTVFDLGSLVRPSTRDYLIGEMDKGNPLIIAWIPEEFWLSHAFLVTGYEGTDLATGHVYVHDPSGYFVSAPSGPDIHVEMTWNQFFDRIEGWIPVGNNASCIHANAIESNAGTTLSMDLDEGFSSTAHQDNNVWLEWDGALHNGYYWEVANDNPGLTRQTVSGHETTGFAVWFNDQLTLSPTIWNFTTAERAGRVHAYIVKNGSIVLQRSEEFTVASRDNEYRYIVFDLWEMLPSSEGECFLRLDLYDTTGSGETLVDTVQAPVYLENRGDPLIVGAVRDGPGNPLKDAVVTAEGTDGGTPFTITDDTSSMGSYTMLLPRGCNASISAEKPGYSIPNTYIHLNLTTSTRHDFSGFPESVAVSGRVTRADNGNGMDGVTVAFSSGAGSVTTAAGGYFSHAVPYGWTGTVTPQFTDWQFTPISHTFTTPLATPPAPLAFSGSEIPTAYIVTDRDSMKVVEGSDSLFRVKLSDAPPSDVYVSVARTSGDSDITIVEGSSRTFAPSNWDTYQNVRPAAAEDGDNVEGIATVTCSASGYADKNVTVQEQENDSGSLMVEIEPSEAKAEGARWRVDGGSWQQGGETVGGLSTVGERVVEFKDVSGWYTPASFEIHIPHHSPFKAATSQYSRVVGGTGSVQMNIEPAGAASAGAQWRIDGGAWKNSGERIHNVASRIHAIDFLAVPGYVTPASQAINLVPNADFYNAGRYSSTSMVTYVDPGESIQSAIDGASDGEHIILNDGTHSLPDSTTLSITEGITLRSLSGYSACTIISDDNDRTLSVNHSNAVVDGIALTSGLGSSEVNGSGGAVSLSKGILANCRVYDSYAEDYGGGVTGNGRIENCLIENCKVQLESGGGVYGSGDILFTTVRSCTADEDGGGVAGQPTLVGCEVSGNRANDDDGGGAWFNGDAIVRNCLFVNNYALVRGGGLHLSDNGTISNCIISDNVSGSKGGGINVEGSGETVIRDSQISDNDAISNGGGIHRSVSGTSSLIISNCVVTGNRSLEGGEGGGVFGYNKLLLVDSKVSDNTADDPDNTSDRGGGVYTEEDGKLVRCIIADNVSGGDGGGVWVRGGIDLESCLIYGNSARNGGGYYQDYDHNTVLDCTITENSASVEGGGALLDHRSVTFRNCIIYGNSAPTYPNYNHDDNDVSAYNCILSPLPDGEGAGNTTVDPQFSSPESADYRLALGSPGIDGGTTTATEYDLDGVPCPLDGDGDGSEITDIGCYEYAPPHGTVLLGIEPIHARDRSAQWRLDGGAWNSSDIELTHIPVGVHTATFSEVSGWDTPSPVTFHLSEGEYYSTNGVYLALSNDTDDDEIPDDYELAIMGRLFHFSFDGDYDSDKMPDYYEWLSGTDPTDPLSCLIFNKGAISSAPGGGITLRWYSGSGMSFKILRSTNLVEGFEEIDTGVTATPPMNFYTDPEPTGTGGWFYMIKRDD